MDKKAHIALVAIQWVLAFSWLQSGWEKFTSPGFMDNLGETLTGFAGKTPYHFYSNYLTRTVIPNSDLFGNLVRGGELLIGLALVLGGYFVLRNVKPTPLVLWLMIFALLAGCFLNLNFYLAAAWASPSTAGINLVMGAIQLILVIYYLMNRKLS